MRREGRHAVLALMLVFGSFFAHGQVTGSVDLVLLLDTSSSMSPSHEAVSGYITTQFLGEFLRAGDIFHFIPFSSRPRLDVSRRIENRRDLEIIISRMLLHPPLQSGSDISAALNFAESHINSLPSLRPSIIVLVSDNTAQQSYINAAKARLGARGITLEHVTVIHGQPLANLPVSGRPSPARLAAQPAPPVYPVGVAVTQPAVPTEQTAPMPILDALAVNEPVQEAAPVYLAMPPAIYTPVEIIQEADTITGAAEFVLIPQIPAGVYAEINDTQETADAPVLTPQQPQERISAFFVLVLMAGAGLFALLIMFAARRFKKRAGPKQSAAETPAVQRDLPQVKQPSKELSPAPAVVKNHLPPALQKWPSKDAVTRPLINTANNRLSKYAAIQAKPLTISSQNQTANTRFSGLTAPVVLPGRTEPMFVNLFVEDQSTAIGKRNIHSIKPGVGFTVGGGSSDFLIFLVNLPSAIGEIRRDGGRCKFIPLKPQFFPDLGSRPLNDCLNKTIRIVSEKKHEVRIRFELCENPMGKLNKALNSLKIPKMSLHKPAGLL